MDNPDRVSLDYVLVADGAHVVGGKLYVLGGGWDRLLVPQLPGVPAAPFAVVAGIRVPWSLTNRKLDFSIDVLDADGERVAQLTAGVLEVGRPPGMRAGTGQRFQLAVPARPEFAAAGTYVIRCSLDGEVLGQTTIEVNLAG